jgi:hypothetical protein
MPTTAPPLAAPFLLTVAAALGCGPAQTPPDASLARLARDLLVPVHSQPADPAGGEYGIWAAGPGYKASFHDGFVFYPHLGPAAPRHLPLHWRTEGIAVGGRAIPITPARECFEGQRFERRCDDAIEAYDARHNGVEQTFTLLRPLGPGDLVITGRVDTLLSCSPTAAAPQDLTFHGADGPTIRYGRAVAIDAGGRRADVATAWDGARIRLTLAGGFLRDAAYPVVVDPLTSSVVLDRHAGLAPPVPSIVAETVSSAPKVVIAWAQSATATDVDVYALVTSFDYSSGTWLYQDVTTAWSTRNVDATYVGAAARWALAIDRDFGANTLFRVYLHDAANTTINAGTTLFPSAPSGLDQRAAVIGGSMFGSTALVVYERFDPASGLVGVWANRVDAAGATLQAAFGFSAGVLVQTSHPRVTPLTFSSTGWVVGLHSNGSLRVAKVPNAGSGTASTSELVPPPPSGTLASAAPSFSLGGSEGRYVMAHAEMDVVAGVQTDRVRTTRFDWESSAPAPAVIARHTLAAASGPPFLGMRFSVGGCEHDQVTRSHWAVSHRTPTGSAVTRVGYRGAPTESQAIPFQGDVAFARPGFEGTFAVAHGDLALPDVTVSARELEYPADAISAVYGTSCANGVSTSTNRSYAGHEFYRVSLNGLPPGTLAIYVFGLVPGRVDLTPQGLPGCFLNVLLPQLGTFVAIADGTGRATISYALPDDPRFVGDIYSQWFFHDPAAAPQPFRAYRGVRHQVR